MKINITVLILIILEVLYEIESTSRVVIGDIVLILIILEVLYEQAGAVFNVIPSKGLNPYYTGSTL